MSGLYDYTGASPTYSITCLVIDQAALAAPPSAATYDLVWLYSSFNQEDAAPVIDASNLVTVPANTTMVFGCAAATSRLCALPTCRFARSTGSPTLPVRRSRRARER